MGKNESPSGSAGRIAEGLEMADRGDREREGPPSVGFNCDATHWRDSRLVASPIEEGSGETDLGKDLDVAAVIEPALEAGGPAVHEAPVRRRLITMLRLRRRQIERLGLGLDQLKERDEVED